ncbi:MAG: dihydroorotase [Dehalococcoidia bacterium]
MPERLLIKGGRILDPANGVDIASGSVLIEDGKIAAVGASVSADGARVIDAAGLVITPGFVDLHTHLRDPGFEYKETVETGTRAAARGGFTTVCCMPNTEPALDNKAAIDLVLRKAANEAAVRVLPIGAVTMDRAGKILTEMGELADAGCIGFSDDGSPIADASIMRHALEYADGLDLPIIDHCESLALAGGVMHEGWVSSRLGLKGIPAASEVSMIARDLALAEQTGAHVHIAHISTAAGVELVRRAKAAGLRVTAEVTPHNLALNHEAIMFRPGETMLAYDTNAKMYPPLRAEEDRLACVRGLADGTIDAIATDHAPHAIQEKACEFDQAVFGITMLETAFGLSMRAVEAGELSFERLIATLTSSPVRALKLERGVPGIGSLSVGAPADVTLIDPSREWAVDPMSFESKGKNTPLGGQTLRGQVVTTIYGGSVVFELQGAPA